jgi:hypothetical protein
MKKTVLTLTILMAVSMAANAFVDTEYMTTEQYIVNTGYSKDMAKEMMVVKQDPYRPEFSDKDQRSFKDVTRKIYNYIAPTMYTDYNYYNHSIKFNTTDWRDL